jgi:hypothetical protein
MHAYLSLIHPYMDGYSYVDLYMYTQTYIYIYICMYVCMYVCMYLSLINTYMDGYTYVDLYMYTMHVHLSPLVSLPSSLSLSSSLPPSSLSLSLSVALSLSLSLRWSTPAGLEESSCSRCFVLRFCFFIISYHIILYYLCPPPFPFPH